MAIGLDATTAELKELNLKRFQDDVVASRLRHTQTQLQMAPEINLFGRVTPQGVKAFEAELKDPKSLYYLENHSSAWVWLYHFSLGLSRYSIFPGLNNVSNDSILWARGFLMRVLPPLVREDVLLRLDVQKDLKYSSDQWSRVMEACIETFPPVTIKTYLKDARTATVGKTTLLTALHGSFIQVLPQIKEMVKTLDALDKLTKIRFEFFNFVIERYGACDITKFTAMQLHFLTTDYERMVMLQIDEHRANAARLEEEKAAIESKALEHPDTQPALSIACGEPKPEPQPSVETIATPANPASAAPTSAAPTTAAASKPSPAPVATKAEAAPTEAQATVPNPSVSAPKVNPSAGETRPFTFAEKPKETKPEIKQEPKSEIKQEPEVEPKVEPKSFLFSSQKEPLAVRKPVTTPQTYSKPAQEVPKVTPDWLANVEPVFSYNCTRTKAERKLFSFTNRPNPQIQVPSDPAPKSIFTAPEVKLFSFGAPGVKPFSFAENPPGPFTFKANTPEKASTFNSGQTFGKFSFGEATKEPLPQCSFGNAEDITPSPFRSTLFCTEPKAEPPSSPGSNASSSPSDDGLVHLNYLGRPYGV